MVSIMARGSSGYLVTYLGLRGRDYLEINLPRPVVQKDRMQTILGHFYLAKLRSSHSCAKIYETPDENCFIVNDLPSYRSAYPFFDHTGEVFPIL